MAETIIITNDATKRRAIDAVTRLDQSRQWVVSIKRKVRRRSNDQNALMWSWIDLVAGLVGDHTGYQKYEIHEFFKQNFLPASPVEIGDRRADYRTTTILSAAELAAYMEAIDRWCAGELGLILPRPEDAYHEQ